MVKSEAQLPTSVFWKVDTETRAKVLELRRQGKTHAEVDAALGLWKGGSAAYAHRIKKGRSKPRSDSLVGTNRSHFGSRRKGKGKLVEADVVLIKRRLGIGEAAKKIAAEFGVSEATICDIRKGRNWSWVTP